VTQQPLFPIVNGKYKMDREPIVRIGVVLAEDRKKTVELAFPEGEEYLVHSGDRQVRIQGGMEGACRVEAAEGGLTLRSAQNEALCSGSSLTVGPAGEGAAPQPGDGIRVENIVAGRGFHWRKEITQTLTGALEFHAVEGFVVMVNRLPLEEYLIGVITGEMSGECPEEFMKAQAVAARSWLLAQVEEKHAHDPFDWCNDDCCQRYQGSGGWSARAVKAIADCRGEVLITPSKHYCDARYSKSCGGVAEDAEVVWGEPMEGLVPILDAPEGSDAARFYPVTEENLREYLEGEWIKDTDIFCSPAVVPEETITKYLGRVDEQSKYFRWEKVLTQASLQESLVERAGLTDLARVIDLHPVKRGASGRLNKLEVEYETKGGERKKALLKSEYDIRAGLSAQFLYSGAFILEVVKRDGEGNLESVKLLGGGWGHGAGLCQIGALGMALKGYSYQDIVTHYYTGVRLERIYG